MVDQARSTLWTVTAWLTFPIVPVLLASSFYSTVNIGGEDPRQWGFWRGMVLLGPLAGYGYLAGATLRLPDDHEKRDWRSLLSRRALWLGLGPWFGFLVVAGIYLTLGGIDWVLVRILSDDRLAAWRQVTNWGPNRPGVDILVIGVVAYGWVVVALAAARRAFTRGRLWKSICRGLLTAGGFLGSLMGGFWAATSVFRAYFFDPRIAQVLLIAGLSIFLLGGCGPPPTVGDVRRRELFQAMMMAWVLGLALVWRWLARERS